jgi:hypothetical protein
MAERNSSTTGTTRGTERGNTPAASARGATGSTAQPNSERTATPAWQQGERASGSTSSSESQSRGLVGAVRDRATAQLTTQKDRALDGLGGVADAVRKTTQSLREQQHETLAGYVEQAADQIERFSRNLKNKDVGELVRDAQSLARRQPAVFVGSAFAIGLLGARFFKSSSPDRGIYRGSQYGGQYGSGYRTDSERSAYGAGTYGTERF